MSEVEARLRRRIASGGPIPFAAFMEQALYGEGGYYARPELPIGDTGDFVTAASHSPLVGAATARLVERLDAELGGLADYLEVGYGNGEHLSAVVAGLTDGRRRLLAHDRIPRRVPAPVERLTELDALEHGSLRGLVFSFELFDALPVHRLVQGEDGLEELWVGLEDGGAFGWHLRALSDPGLVELLPAPLARGQIADLAPGWRPLYRRLARLLGAGLLVTCDYGFEGSRLVDPRVRRHGTLACYRRQRVHRDALATPGEQDLTAHVDFTALRQEGEAAGLETLAYIPLAPWLAALGLLEDLAAATPAERLRAHQVMALDGMGEEIRVLVQGRGVSRRALGALALS